MGYDEKKKGIVIGHKEKIQEGQEGHHRSSGIVEIVVLFILPLLSHYLIPIKTVIHPPYSYSGIFVILSGLWLMILAAKAFRKAGTAFQLEEGGSALVTSGPFSFSRNPMYLGILVWLTGFAVLLGSLVVFIVPVIFFLVMQIILIPIEEKRMQQIFGEEYKKYKRQVRRWL